MKAHVDEDTCIGCGLCASIAPQTFEMDGDLAKVIEEPVSDEEAAREACEECPVDAITLED
ncbi:MAG: ferredoxin [Clostridiales bacterium]|nr:ferredoxin [Clostridiales bacterium]